MVWVISQTIGAELRAAYILLAEAKERYIDIQLFGNPSLAIEWLSGGYTDQNLFLQEALNMIKEV